MDKSRLTFLGVIITIGIIFGDIGTSVLYVMKSFVRSSDAMMSENLVLGFVSLIFWVMTLQTTTKYVLIALKADNNGEGGVFSLFALIKNRTKRGVVLLAMIGGATLLADGIITPAITVTSAVEGLHDIIPAINTNDVIILVLIIFIFIFSFQRFGTKKIGSLFGPIMSLWFLSLFFWGVKSIGTRPEILKAINPKYALNLLITYPGVFVLLGAVFLCVSGAEDLYVDLGHCGRKNVRMAWFVVKVCLLANYFGQAAYLLSTNYSSEKNPFFAIVPESFVVFQVILATLAAIIASQSLITGSFTLISEAIKLNLFPKLIIKYPTELKGQVYVSAVNIILFICSSCVVIFFRTSSNMEAAYGLSISITMFVTTLLLSIYLYKVKSKKLFAVIFLIFFGIEELFFLYANSLKFVNGGYITVFIALLIFIIMFIWYRGTEIKERESQYLTVKNYTKQLLQLSMDKSVPKYATNLVYLTGAKREEDVDYAVLYSILNKQPKRANVYFFVHINVIDKPYKREYKVTKFSDKKILKITFNLGFREHQRVNMFMHQVIDDLLMNKELELQPTKYNLRGKAETVGDFRFVLIEEVLGNSNGLSSFDNFIMGLRLKLKKITVTPEKWFGLDTSVITKEAVPLNVVQTKVKRLTRIQ
ncbi:KUP/HAK/KT family potassium transporter [Gemella haemolysans]|uniref:Probable potassium transport system protein Kup n=1 Tax=Gemella haemolysans TaxID=1379 RepID=A0AAW6B7L5_9BACL|nr:KUP/HAK/KT family potassium transporter [Gemella haemolysans]MDB6186755.1 KUP/HAK/KT family potassium transporter [Gemella haemolysans]MDU1527062.1 KUP/HAK/KT family potassium transporter [Gemella haemolysans]MDU4714971.1 KUP/HAK/KT family potassium transporter [Gemella haemolysans]